MAKGKNEKEQGGENPQVEAQTETPTTYSAEEVAAREARIIAESEAKIQAAKEEARKETYSKLNPKISELTQKLKQKPQVTGSLDAVQALAETMQSELGIDNPKVQNALSVLAQEKNRIKQAQEQAAREEQYNQWVNLANAEWEKLEQKLVESGFDSNSDEYESVHDKWEYGRDVSGNFDKAQKRLDRILKVAKTKGDTVTKSKEDKDLRKAGEGDIPFQDIAQPSASSPNDWQVIDDYGKGKATRSQYLQAKKNLGI